MDHLTIDDAIAYLNEVQLRFIPADSAGDTMCNAIAVTLGQCSKLAGDVLKADEYGPDPAVNDAIETAKKLKANP